MTGQKLSEPYCRLFAFLVIHIAHEQMGLFTHFLTTIENKKNIVIFGVYRRGGRSSIPLYMLYTYVYIS